jgi:hypothetical protein
MTTKLDAVNQMLSYIGSSAVNTIDNDNPEIYSAVSILDEVTRSVLSEGWDFNSEQKYPFNPDSVTGEISIPSNLLYFEANLEEHTNDYQLVVRDGKMYDKKDHTYVFTEQVKCDVVWSTEFEDLPQAFKEYVTARAGRNFQARFVGSKETYELIVQDEQLLRAACIEYDTRTSNPNVFGTRDGQNPIYTYMPYQTLRR